MIAAGTFAANVNPRGLIRNMLRFAEGGAAEAGAAESLSVSLDWGGATIGWVWSEFISGNKSDLTNSRAKIQRLTPVMLFGTAPGEFTF
jgi:hypothetical protein